eukprot:Gregarina_sp_Poly_1__4730@NODE_2528_length_2021_cov_321_812180_g1580_i1_p1_GENE_NODE_2528_length_2021_cov_321_812180_g1580_i1NODE_2528_length_2021_cov_321_812180_g1580_i1_p1_ORF_typecomplete_len255_score28_48START/PF01852_19/4_9e11DUF3074/PF11274_8/0_029_NODE_2528_length_2021_cov_321_812180_g1580_i110241788
MESILQTREFVMNQLQPIHVALADEACDSVRNFCTSIDKWSLWENKPHLKLEKCEITPGRVAGRGTHCWKTDNYTLDAVEDFLWDNEAKSQYDEFSAAMLLLVQYEGDYHIVDQIFRSRFGISGRDFVVVVHKRREDTETHEILVIGVQSIPTEHELHVERIIEPAVAEKYWKMKEKVVRGTAFAAGYYAERNKTTNEFRLTYVTDADVKSKGVPQWIVTRVKLDQLKIVHNIPRCIDKFLLEKREVLKQSPNC